MGILAETIKEFKGCTIQSAISNSAQYDSDKQIDAINDSDEKVDAINDSNEQVDAINNSEELVDAGSNPTSDPSSDSKVATYTTNRIFHKICWGSGLSPRSSKALMILLNSLSPSM